MLFETIHLPAIYDLSNDNSDQTTYCRQLIEILKDSLVNCVVLIDDEEDVRHALHDAVCTWPLKHRPKAQALLSSLYQTNRFIRTPIDHTAPGVACGLDACEKCRCIGSASLALVLVRKDCEFCRTTALPNHVYVDDYCDSDFRESRKEREKLRVPPGTWTPNQFAAQVWHPIFRYAKDVDLVDRNIGRTTTQKPFGPKQNYTSTLKWIFEEAAHVSSSQLCTITIYTGTMGSEDKGLEVYAAWQDWLSGTCSHLDLKFKVNFCLFREQNNAELPHARYLFTDQVALEIERGFDLLKRGNEIAMRDVEITVLDRSRRDSILTEVRQLRRLPRRF